MGCPAQDGLVPAVIAIETEGTLVGSLMIVIGFEVKLSAPQKLV